MSTIKINTAVTSITELYDKVALAMGKNPYECKYNCTKIKVAKNFADEIEAAYKAKDPDNYVMAFGMHWVCYGPKTDEHLADGIVKIEEGFFE